MEGYTAPDYADYSDVPVYAASDAVATYEAAGDDPALAALASNIPGVPGEDYPIYAEVTVFSTLIGPAPTRLGSHWSRASVCCYASNLMP